MNPMILSIVIVNRDATWSGKKRGRSPPLAGMSSPLSRLRIDGERFFEASLSLHLNSIIEDVNSHLAE